MKAAIYNKRINLMKGEVDVCKEYILSDIDKDAQIYIYDEEKNEEVKYKQLLDDIQEKNINLVMCYKIDMMGLSQIQLLNMINIINENNCRFISIKESYFDTSTCIGKAILNKTSLYFEDKEDNKKYWNILQILKSRKYINGKVPLGFFCEKVIYIDEKLKRRTNMRLKGIDGELEIVKMIFATYKKHKSMVSITDKLNREIGIKRIKLSSDDIKKILLNPLYIISDNESNDYLQKSGKTIIGIPNGNGYLDIICKNNRKDILAVSNHKGIIKSADWICINKFIKGTKEIYEEC